jgi:hypothetical protein
MTTATSSKVRIWHGNSNLINSSGTSQKSNLINNLGTAQQQHCRATATSSTVQVMQKNSILINISSSVLHHNCNPMPRVEFLKRNLFSSNFKMIKKKENLKAKKKRCWILLCKSQLSRRILLTT